MPFEELKKKQSVVWGSGPYERIGATVADVHEAVLVRLQIQPGERVLDLATGTGECARPAARLGADVTAVDLSPALIETAKRRMAEEGLSIRLDVGDAENLEFEDATFDVVVSTFGVMFAPDHGAVARELARVTRPGGRIALASWRPEGAIFEHFGAMKPFQPPAPPGVGDPFDWGREGRVTELLGDAFELEFETGNSPLTAESGEEVWQLFSTSFGPTKTLAESLGPDRREELRRAWREVYERYRVSDGIEARRPYLLVLGTRR